MMTATVQSPSPLLPFGSPEAIPAELRARPRWLPWRGEWNQKRNKGAGKWDKIPYHKIGTTRPDRWKPFDEALQLLTGGGDEFRGLGYCVTGDAGLVFIDLDDCALADGTPDAWAQGIIDQVASYTERSPSGHGFRIIALADGPEPDWTRHGERDGIEVYWGASARFLTVTGLPLDGSSGILSRLAPECLEAIRRENGGTRVKAEVIDINMPDLLDPATLPAVEALQLPAAVSEFLSTGKTSADRSQTLFASGVSLYAAGLDDATVLSVLAYNEHAMGVALDHRGQDRARAELYLWNEDCLKARAKGVAARVSDDEFDVVPMEEGSEARQLPPFTRDKQGRIEATLVNVLTAVRTEGTRPWRVAHDRFTDALMRAPDGGDQWQRFGDTDYTALREYLERRGFKPISGLLIRDVVLAVAAENEFDSAQLWLSALPEHDGQARVETFLHDYLGAEDTPYTRAVSMYLWTALVARVLDPGCQADMVPVLVGSQGIEKTSAVRAIAPSVDQFVELDLAERDADLSRSLRGKLVGELGELRGLASRDADGIKSWITRRVEEWIPKYQEFGTSFPRRLVFFGTTNNGEFLADDTGERRWLPLRVSACDAASIARDREQLWAEARDLYSLLGVDWREAQRLGRQASLEFKIVDPWTEEIARWLDEPDLDGAKPWNRSFLRATDVLTGAMGMARDRIGRREELRVSSALRALGYERVKIRVEHATVWAFRRGGGA